MKKRESPARVFPFLVHQTEVMSLFDALQFRPPAFGACRRGWFIIRQFFRRYGFPVISERQGRITDIEGHPGTILARIDRRNLADRHRQLTGDTTETCMKLDQFIAHLQFVGCIRAEIQDDLTIADKFTGHLRASINLDCDVRRETVIAAPLPDGTQQVRLGRW